MTLYLYVTTGLIIFMIVYWISKQAKEFGRYLCSTATAETTMENNSGQNREVLNVSSVYQGSCLNPLINNGPTCSLNRTSRHEEVSQDLPPSYDESLQMDLQQQMEGKTFKDS